MRGWLILGAFLAAVVVTEWIDCDVELDGFVVDGIARLERMLAAHAAFEEYLRERDA